MCLTCINTNVITSHTVDNLGMGKVALLLLVWNLHVQLPIELKWKAVLEQFYNLHSSKLKQYLGSLIAFFSVCN